ncbi:TetR family transcriptional regulator [Jatrophihabitans telluris]|uniref:TetR family transcriptional regulator n=1 Tax=Jatrophihabitans telluris TaxID=2038343 RepID=A0ABY4QZM2_9ACTN|nr:TetR family transcriptional regulator [Jatrophihabitans telluris]UQX88306.1 TetR family transcriptional regulator [Jatrophihabitans telluris]
MATRTSPKKAAPNLDRGQLVERALAIADLESLDAITIRRLASEFGVTPMALYWHFENKEALLAAMGDAFYDRIELGPLSDPGEQWDKRLRRVLDALVDTLRRHPASSSLAMPRILQCASGLALTELTLQLLVDAGFSTQESADIARTALQTVMMLVAGQPGGEFTVATQQRDQVLADKRRTISQLPAERYPRVIESVGALTACEDDDSYFGYGIDLFLAGVCSRHAQLSLV